MSRFYFLGFKCFKRLIYSSTSLLNKPLAKKQSETIPPLLQLIKKHQNKIIYNSFIYDNHPQLCIKANYFVLKNLGASERKRSLELAAIEPLPITLKYTTGANEVDNEPKLPNASSDQNETDFVHFPYSQQTAAPLIANLQKLQTNEVDNIAEISESEIQKRQEALKNASTRDWMTSYENYDEIKNTNEFIDDHSINYGTPNPTSKVSNVPCGGCGALLHCKDTSIPGYIPSEIYRNCFRAECDDLHSLICQRCHFLKNYDIALQVRVAHQDYQKVLEPIKDKRALVILMVDLLDFPCSIWPGIVDVIGSMKPIIVVGNKVDLLPRDSTSYLNRIKEQLKECVLKTVTNESNANIKHVELISAKTGWGVETLINKLHNVWKYRGDVYLVGSTNVGKSTLFNCLLQSDYCKTKAVDLVQRATTSVWPGTTLNLLKFPILRPSGWRLHVRTKRLESLQKTMAAEAKLKKLQLQRTKNPEHAILIGRIDRTFTNQEEPPKAADLFSISGDRKIRLGINENHPDYVASKWCYDTPGVVPQTQIIHLLTTEELMLTLPKNMIQPKSFNVRMGQTLFIAGLGRVDYVTGENTIKLTVFCANTLPITMCDTDNANVLYNEFLGTDVFKVPIGSPNRLRQWPGLKMVGTFKMVGSADYSSCGDIVVSNAGWVAVQCAPGSEVVFNAWAPGGCGVYSRKSILPYIVKSKGTKIVKTPVYIHDRAFICK